jgi:hypothetical protein
MYTFVQTNFLKLKIPFGVLNFKMTILINNQQTNFINIMKVLKHILYYYINKDLSADVIMEIMHLV